MSMKKPHYLTEKIKFYLGTSLLTLAFLILFFSDIRDLGGLEEYELRDLNRGIEKLDKASSALRG